MLQDELGLSSADFEEFFIQEKTYLEGLKSTPADVTLKIQYVQGLNKLAHIRYARFSPSVQSTLLTQFSQEWDISHSEANQALFFFFF